MTLLGVGTLVLIMGILGIMIMRRRLLRPPATLAELRRRLKALQDRNHSPDR
jgi:hypothetical protein